MRTPPSARWAAPAAVIGVSIVSMAAPATAQVAPWPTDAWAQSTPAAEGLSESALAALDGRIRDGDFGYIDHVLVVRNGRVVFNRRYDNDYRAISRGRRSEIGCGFECPDPAWDHQFNYLHPDWHPYHQGRDVHTLQSVTKSISATLIGAAIGQGAIPGVDAPLLPYLSDYDVSRVESGLRAATLEDLLTMRLGIEWHETDRPMDDSNTTIRLERSQDWVQFTLDQPVDAAPGERWVYNSGGSQLMSAIVAKTTGQRMDRFAERHLFGPLGIDDYHWKITPAGLPDALGGLYLRAEDLAKIGYLYLHDGVWEDRRILPEGWVAAATARHVSDPGYGYQWWRPDPAGEEVWAGLGFGGQSLLVFPDRDVVAVVYSWNLFGAPTEDIREALAEALLSPLDTMTFDPGAVRSDAEGRRIVHVHESVEPGR